METSTVVSDTFESVTNKRVLFLVTDRWKRTVSLIVVAVYRFYFLMYVVWESKYCGGEKEINVEILTELAIYVTHVTRVSVCMCSPLAQERLGGCY
jgi:hypothetical protein